MRLLLAILLLLIVAPAAAQQGQGMSRALVVSSCGGGALPSGAVNQLTMDTTGRLCTHKTSAGSGCSQATAYLARAPGETMHAADMTTLICGLVIDGVWAKLDALYMLAQQTQADARLNLISTNYTALILARSGLRPIPQLVGAFTAFQGMTTFSWDTQFNPTTATSPNYTQNSASFGFWTSASPQESFPQMGNDVTSSIYDNYTGALFYSRVNNAAIGSVASPATSGLYVGDRESAIGVNPFYNGVDKGLLTGTSGAPFNATFLLGNSQGGAVTFQLVSEAHIGGSLGTTLELALYNRLRTYLTAVGVP